MVFSARYYELNSVTIPLRILIAFVTVFYLRIDGTSSYYTMLAVYE